MAGDPERPSRVRTERAGQSACAISGVEDASGRQRHVGGSTRVLREVTGDIEDDIGRLAGYRRHVGHRERA